MQATMNNMSTARANLIEMFSSIQGEGILVGLRQAFIRFYGCNLSCVYCDSRNTVYSRPPEFCRVEKKPGWGEFSFINNPVDLDAVNGYLRGLLDSSPKAHHSLSITGGEPLRQASALKEWLPYLRSLLPIYLETNGVLHFELSEVVDYLDYVAMDVKLPSTSGAGELWEEHRKFLQLASKRNLFVKSVVDNNTLVDEIRHMCEIISSVDRAIPLVLQPVTSKDGHIDINTATLMELQEAASDLLEEVRVIPQTHVFMSLL